LNFWEGRLLGGWLIKSSFITKEKMKDCHITTKVQKKSKKKKNSQIKKIPEGKKKSKKIT